MRALEIQGLGKAYRSYRSPWRRIGSWFDLCEADRETWVLQDVSFSAIPGETIGILGHNGAGKSTLLKLITGTLRPTTGSAIANGRISAILELGMGFNPEMTGRENARHGLNLAGIPIETIETLLPEIHEFSEIGTFFDQPLRTYSSGMQVRVAFAVATAVRPEILIVDEALSVGDAYFQHKSFKRIREFQAAGTTLLFVSHDTNAIQAICDRALLFERGRLLRDDRPDVVVDHYNHLIAQRTESDQIEELIGEEGRVQTVSGSRKVAIEAVEVLDSEGRNAEVVGTGARTTLRVEAKVREPVEALVLGVSIRDRLGQTIYGTNTWYTDQTLSELRAGQNIVFDVVFPCDLGPGTYSVAIALTSSETHLVENYEWRNLAAVFEVVNLDKPIFIGSAWLDTTIKIAISDSRSERADTAEEGPSLQ
ncbi:MAG: ABC transporter ATP-binding protein [Pseudomonadota bacterium]|nr:ABC transporter ATP-binding protein [Pseudomonadota bacterium]